ncbi:hypothetical protein D3C85_1137730 [compost metagenome]
MQRHAALQHDGVVLGRIDQAVGHLHVTASIDVDAVAVGVHGQTVDADIGRAQDVAGEMPALQDGEVAQQDVAAARQADGLVAPSLIRHLARDGPARFIGGQALLGGRLPAGHAVPARRRPLAVQAKAVDQPLADDGHVVDAVPVNQTVMEMADAIVLKLLVEDVLGQVVLARVLARVRRLDHRPVHQHQGDEAAQADRKAQIMPRRHHHGSTALGGGCLDGLVDGVGINGNAVADSAVVAHIVEAAQ